MTGIITWIRNAYRVIGRGDILLKLKVHKYLPHICVAFAACVFSMILSFYADRTLTLRERKIKELESVKIIYSGKYQELVSLYRYTTVEDMLGKAGSDLEPLRKPAAELK